VGLGRLLGLVDLPVGPVLGLVVGLVVGLVLVGRVAGADRAAGPPPAAWAGSAVDRVDRLSPRTTDIAARTDVKMRRYRLAGMRCSLVLPSGVAEEPTT
jgi:hypothetical protein